MGKKVTPEKICDLIVAAFDSVEDQSKNFILRNPEDETKFSNGCKLFKSKNPTTEFGINDATVFIMDENKNN